MANLDEYIETLKGQVAALKAKIDSMRNPRQLPTIVTGVDVEIVKPAPKTKKKGKNVVTAEVVPKEEENISTEEAQLLTNLASLSELTEIRKKLEKEEFEGKLDPRTLSATDTLQWLNLVEDPPHKAWISAYFISDGADNIEIMINRLIGKRHTLKSGETLTIDHTHADERIKKIFYQCATGETATVRVAGQY